MIDSVRAEGLQTMVLGDREFNALRALIFKASGISLGPGKRELVASRLARRVRALQLADLGEYHAYLTSPGRDPDEMQRMLNCITTNKTDFFREPHHFHTLATLMQRTAGAPVRIWSAGCSTGEEPYTIAMTASETLGAEADRVGIVATDLDTDVLARAASGTYGDERMGGVSDERRRRHFLRGRGSADGSWQVKPALRDMISFRPLNFVAAQWGMKERFDAIFCRNVIIYFDRDTQERLIGRFASLLEPGGLLFLGHSENLHWMSGTFEPLGNTVYRLRGEGRGARPASRRPAVAAPAPAPRHALPPESERPPVTEGAASRIRINAGEIAASREPATIVTLLGSCVAVCLRDPVTAIGGMNHFMLPEGDSDVPARYGVHAMELLINRIMALGGDRRRLEAKVFGASNVLPHSGTSETVGDRNARFTLNFLDLEGIPVRVQRLGGNRPLEIRFATDTGRVLLRTLPATTYQQAAEHERRHRRAVAEQLGQADVTIFPDSR